MSDEAIQWSSCQTCGAPIILNKLVSRGWLHSKAGSDHAAVPPDAEQPPVIPPQSVASAVRNVPEADGARESRRWTLRNLISLIFGIVAVRTAYGLLANWSFEQWLVPNWLTAGAMVLGLGLWLVSDNDDHEMRHSAPFIALAGLFAVFTMSVLGVTVYRWGRGEWSAIDVLVISSCVTTIWAYRDAKRRGGERVELSWGAIAAAGVPAAWAALLLVGTVLGPPFFVGLLPPLLGFFRH